MQHHFPEREKDFKPLFLKILLGGLFAGITCRQDKITPPGTEGFHLAPIVMKMGFFYGIQVERFGDDPLMGFDKRIEILKFSGIDRISLHCAV